MKPCESKPIVMYGLCKVHKGITPNDRVPPFPPILSAIGTCSYNLAKLFAPLKKEYTINEYTVKGAFSFCKEIVNQDPQLFMALFDTESLKKEKSKDFYTNCLLPAKYPILLVIKKKS